MALTLTTWGKKAAAAVSIITLLTLTVTTFNAVHSKYALAADVDGLYKIIKEDKEADINDTIDQLDLRISSLRIKQINGTISNEEVLELEILISRKERYQETLKSLRNTD